MTIESQAKKEKQENEKQSEYQKTLTQRLNHIL